MAENSGNGSETFKQTQQQWFHLQRVVLHRNHLQTPSSIIQRTLTLVLFALLRLPSSPHHQQQQQQFIFFNFPKSLYKSWYEKDKAKRVAAHKRAVLRIESRITENSRRIEELRTRLVEESNRMKAVAFELSNLRRVRQASVALNVWQPEVVRGRQKEIVEQCAVPVDSRINALEMELKLCKQHLIVHEKNYRDEKRRLEVAKEQLSLMRYHPLQNVSVDERRVGEPSAKRKKLKTHISADDEQNWKL